MHDVEGGWQKTGDQHDRLQAHQWQGTRESVGAECDRQGECHVHRGEIVNGLRRSISDGCSSDEEDAADNQDPAQQRLTLWVRPRWAALARS